MNVRPARPTDAPAVTALGGGCFASPAYMAVTGTRLLVWGGQDDRPAAFAAFTWGEPGSPLTLNGLAPAEHGPAVVAHLLALAARHGRPGLLAAAPESDTASRRLFTSVPCRTRLRRAVDRGEDDIEYLMLRS